MQGLLLRPLPFKDPGQLMMVHLSAPRGDDGRGASREMPWSYPKYRQLFVPNQHAFQEAALFSIIDWTLTSAGTEPERLRGELIDSHYLPVLGVSPQLGRNIDADEDRAPGSAPIVVLSHALWARRFGLDAAIIGRSIGLNGTPHTVVGILPEGFSGLTGEAQLFVPIMSSSNPRLAQLNMPWVQSFLLVARRKADVSVTQVQGDLPATTTTIRSVLQSLDPDLPIVNVRTMGNRFSDATWRTRLSADLLMVFAGLALLLAAIGLYGVMAQGGAQRTREIGIRMALGADRGSIFRLVMSRALTVGTIGVVVGVGTSLLSTPVLETLLYQVQSRDLATTASVAIVLIAVTLLASYVPARRATRVDPLTSLRVD